jgi:hypothetical protein
MNLVPRLARVILLFLVAGSAGFALTAAAVAQSEPWALARHEWEGEQVASAERPGTGSLKAQG